MGFSRNIDLLGMWALVHMAGGGIVGAKTVNGEVGGWGKGLERVERWMWVLSASLDLICCLS
jgi:hypothetical protein